MIRELLMSTPAMLLLTLGSYILGVWIKNKSGWSLMHPMIICLPVILAVLLVFDIPCSHYMEANSLISFLLGPCVVALALKLYDNRQLVMQNLAQISAAVIVGSIVGVGSVILIGKLCGLPQNMILSLESKSVTTPIAMDITRSIGGNVPLVAVTVVITGFLGAVIGPAVLNLLGVKSPIARGCAMGCASHGLGTARALEEGALEGAVSGLCIALAGVVTALVVPILN